MVGAEVAVDDRIHTRTGFTGFFRTPVLLDEGLNHSLYFSAHQKPQIMAEAQAQEILGMFVVTK
jgi:hypothetical protein